MGLYTEKSYREMVNPLINYAGDKDLVKSQIYAMGKGDSDMYKYRNNLQDYNRAIEAGKKNDSDNFFTGIGDFLFGRGTDALRADLSDEYTKAYAANPYEFSGKQYNEDINRTKSEQDFDKGTVFSGGLLGGLLNPITQTAKAGIDLGRGVAGSIAGDKNAWDAWNKRDWLSDLGALGETALTVVPTVRGITGAGKAAATGAKTLGKTIGKGAAMGAGYGLSGGLREMGAKDFNLGNLALGTAVGAGFGGALSGMGYGLGKVNTKLSDIAKKNRAVDEKVYYNTLNDMGDLSAANGVSYQEALKKAGLDQASNPADFQAINNILEGRSVDYLGDTPGRIQSLTNKLNKLASELGEKSEPGLVRYNEDSIQNLYDALKRISNLPTGGSYTTYTTYPGLASTKFKQTLQGAGDLLKDMPNTSKAVSAKVSGAASKVSNSKVGRAAAKALSTKKGKVAAGVGGGLLLSQLLSNKGQSQPTQQELDELYNYIYGG
jgi:hypothetical protein